MLDKEVESSPVATLFRFQSFFISSKRRVFNSVRPRVYAYTNENDWKRSKTGEFWKLSKVEILKTDICRLYVDGKRVQKRRII